MEISSSDEEERIRVNHPGAAAAVRVTTPNQASPATRRRPLAPPFERPHLPFGTERVVVDLGSESDEANTPAALRYGPFPQGYVSPRPQARSARATTPLMQEHELKIARLKRDIALREKKAAEQALRIRRDNGSSPSSVPSSVPSSSPNTAPHAIQSNVTVTAATIVNSAPVSVASAAVASMPSLMPSMPVTPTLTPPAQADRPSPAGSDVQGPRGAKRPGSPPPSEHARQDFERTLDAIQQEINKNRKALAAASDNVNRSPVNRFASSSLREGKSCPSSSGNGSDSSMSHHIPAGRSEPSAPQTSQPTATEEVDLQEDDTSVYSDTSSLSTDSVSDDEYMTAPESPDREEDRLRQEITELNARRAGVDKSTGWSRKKKLHFETAALGVRAKLSLCVPPAKKQKLGSSATPIASRPHRIPSQGNTSSAPTTPLQEGWVKQKKEEVPIMRRFATTWHGLTPVIDSTRPICSASGSALRVFDFFQTDTVHTPQRPPTTALAIPAFRASTSRAPAYPRRPASFAYSSSSAATSCQRHH